MREKTGIVPLALQNKPVLSDRLTYFYRVYLELSVERRFDSMGKPLPLTRRNVLDYCAIEGVGTDFARWVWPMVQMFDLAWMDGINRKRQSTTDQTVVRQA